MAAPEFKLEPFVFKKSPPSAIQTTPEAPRGLSLKQAASYSGLALWTLRTLVWDGRLPAVKIGRRLVILRDTLDSFLKSRETSR